jgi:hypothetical protein
MEHDLQLDEITKSKVLEHLILFAVKFREYFRDMTDDYDCICDTFVTLIFFTTHVVYWGSRIIIRKLFQLRIEKSKKSSSNNQRWQESSSIAAEK